MRSILKSLAIRGLASAPIRALARPFYGGRGVIFTLHRVLTAPTITLIPGIAVTETFLDAMLTHLRRRGVAVISVAEAMEELSMRAHNRARFACLTFDDGYRDNVSVALPVLKAHSAPFSIYLVSEWVSRRGACPIAVLERGLLQIPVFRLPKALGGGTLPTKTIGGKLHAFRFIDAACWHNPEAALAILNAFRDQAVDIEALMSEEFLDEQGARDLAMEPLCTIGSHTSTHPSLGKLHLDEVRLELESSRTALQRITGQPVSELAYPYGDATSCGEREFSLAADAGYRIALTTRPGNLFTASGRRPLALPRTGLSLHPHGHSLRYVDAVLCGARNAAMNGGRRIGAP